MGSDDEFGPDTEAIRAWLNKRASYAKDARVIGGGHRSAPRPTSSDRPERSSAETVTPPTLPVGAVDGTDVGRSVLAALGHDEQADPGPVQPGQVDSTTAGRSVVDALRDTSPTPDPPAPAPPAPAQAPAPRERARRERSSRAPQARTSTPPPSRYTASTASTSPAAPGGRGAPPQARVGSGSRWTEPDEHRYSEDAGTDADFPARGRARLVLSLILLATLAGTAVAGYVAYQDRTVAAIGLAGTLGFLSLVVWAVRTGCTTTKLTLRRGQLSIERGGHTEVVDIANPYHAVAIVGEPGHRRWTVLIERAGQPLIVISSAMVDPYWFTGLLYRIRPELRPDAQPHPAERG
ncbi:hypothetical protein KG112_08190 [Nocardioides sp. zg-ZUI104]|uniref:hypothetical protein n=1 Tax=Nocardioides faecalis TaxID=2803858 RepID=UPI001BD0D7E8|nr:hypothetical protein [Nocardioides faecalis]MBS4752785.1 hypothetical protein [Nocardioides faecalis]